ncbi:protein of unknown function (plasmid) [Methylocella tundrae]|uniref:Uncharacterized protein n=1 Tax=Methylocella tundrae TaxID=227605 RepID=A0A4U8Z8A2_METTU|nr:protein of unknown function [Methylocella tundrae]
MNALERFAIERVIRSESAPDTTEHILVDQIETTRSEYALDRRLRLPQLCSGRRWPLRVAY